MSTLFSTRHSSEYVRRVCKSLSGAKITKTSSIIMLSMVGLGLHSSHPARVEKVRCFCSSRFWTVKPRLHDTTCCQTGCQTGLTTGCIVFDNRFDKRLYRVYSWLLNRLYNVGLTTGWTNSGCSFNMVVKPVWQPVWQPVVCLFTRYSRLSNRL